MQALVGNTIRLGNLDTTRDFTYVHDTVRGFLLAGSAVGAEGGVFNLGTGQEYRIGDIAERIALKVGHKVEITVETQRLRPEKSEVLRLISDNRLARAKLGWEPQVSLDEGLDQTIAWMRSHMDLYRPGQYEF
jgi:dTDP-glucose 4,6-dehydratase